MTKKTRVRNIFANDKDQIIRVVTPLGNIDVGVNMVWHDEGSDLVMVTAEPRNNLVDAIVEKEGDTIMLRRPKNLPESQAKFVNENETPTPRIRKPRQPKAEVIPNAN